MESMIRKQINTHFELVSGALLPEMPVVQVYPKKLYTNEAGIAVFLCEVEDEEEDDG